MKVAITGGTGFIGRHLARALVAAGHDVVLISRGLDVRDRAIRELSGVTFAAAGLDDEAKLVEHFASCQAVAHCAGINRQIETGDFDRVHVAGTKHVINAARTAGVSKVVITSFLRARPNCGSPYHESKWAAEEIVRNSLLDYTVFKSGMIYGKGDHMLDHLSHALHTVPAFASVGLHEKPIRPIAVDDMVSIMVASLVQGRLSRQTVYVVGPEELLLSEAVRRVSDVIGKKPILFPLPVACHQILACVLERVMKIPLISQAQVKMLAEGIVDPLPPCDALPPDLLPTTTFSAPVIREGLPEPGPFSRADLLG